MTVDEIREVKEFASLEYYREFFADVFEYFDKRRAMAKNPPRFLRPNDKYYLVQTISGDCAMGAGIAKAINDRYMFRDAVVAEFAASFSGVKSGDWTFDKKKGCFVLDNLEIHLNKEIGSVVMSEMVPDILGVVTKDKYCDKPTYETMSTGLLGLRQFIDRELYFIEDEDDYSIELIMPTIGCGLDKLNWPEVRRLVLRTFGDLMRSKNVFVTVVRKR